MKAHRDPLTILLQFAQLIPLLYIAYVAGTGMQRLESHEKRLDRLEGPAFAARTPPLDKSVHFP